MKHKCIMCGCDDIENKPGRNKCPMCASIIIKKVDDKVTNFVEELIDSEAEIVYIASEVYEDDNGGGTSAMVFTTFGAFEDECYYEPEEGEPQPGKELHDKIFSLIKENKQLEATNLLEKYGFNHGGATQEYSGCYSKLPELLIKNFKSFDNRTNINKALSFNNLTIEPIIELLFDKLLNLNIIPVYFGNVYIPKITTFGQKSDTIYSGSKYD